MLLLTASWLDLVLFLFFFFCRSWESPYVQSRKVCRESREWYEEKSAATDQYCSKSTAILVLSDILLGSPEDFLLRVPPPHWPKTQLSDSRGKARIESEVSVVGYYLTLVRKCCWCCKGEADPLCHMGMERSLKAMWISETAPQSKLDA